MRLARLSFVTTMKCNVLAPAYIRPEYDLDGHHQTVPFFEYLDGKNREQIFGSHFTNMAFHKREDFWTVYLLNAYQPDISNDNDPDYALLEVVDPIRANSNDEGVVIFLELNRAQEYNHLDIYPEFPGWRYRPVSKQHEIAREVGRMFGGVEEDTELEAGNESLMAKADRRIRGVFGEVTLSKIRRVDFP